MKIGIVGAGISGLSAGLLLSKTNEVEILEKESSIGGIAKVKMFDDTPYHTVGGHCLNSKNSEVMNFIFGKVLAKEQWHQVQRVAKIAIDDHKVDYPIEFSIAQIADFDEDLAYRMTRDFLSSCERKVESLEDWFRMKFGDALAEKYFIPYNKKIWNTPPSGMSHLWVEGKLPIPDKKQFFLSLVKPQRDSMPHSNFYYPNNNTQNQFIAALGSGLDIITDYEVCNIEKDGKLWVVNGDKKFDLIVNTMPLNTLPLRIQGVPDEIKKAADRLLYNKVTTMLWETDEVDATWTYFPEAATIFHRHIHIGNFLRPKSNHTITESMGDISYPLMENAGKKFSYLKKALDYNVSDHAYVIFDHNYSESVKLIKEFLAAIGIHSIGRFGEWEYYNMDMCIESSIRLRDKLKEP